MNLEQQLRNLRGPFTFLRPVPSELRHLASGFGASLPEPQRIFLEREESTPIVGFPILQTAEEEALRAALERYVVAEEELQWAGVTRRATDPQVYQDAWDGYRKLLERATENVTASSFGRRFPSVFWLYHSIAVSRLLKQTLRRLVRRDAELARTHGDLIKYRVFDRFVDKATGLTYDVTQRVAREFEDREDDVFPHLLHLMRDNVLILTEDHIGPDLSQLRSYFSGHLQIDGEAFRAKLARVAEWVGAATASDPSLAATLRYFCDGDLPEDPWRLIRRAGLVSLLHDWPGYPLDGLSRPEVVIWEKLLIKLKEFELMLGARRLMLPVLENAEGRMVCRVAFWNSGSREVFLSDTTRPLVFMKPWVVDPQVSRFGLIYDITDFSAVLTLLGRASDAEQDQSFRRIFRFQRRVNRVARRHRMHLEKYLGDGGFYSGRHPSRLLVVALELQRFYQRAVDDGFPFDRGLRIALNYGTYKLLPIDQAGEHGELRYEFFGQGIVELSRLATGKAMRDIDETKTLLLGLGYQPAEVDRFFAPVQSQNVNLIDRSEEERRFYAYINENGALVNEGIAATERYVQRLVALDPPRELRRLTTGRRDYVLFEVEAGGEEYRIGMRRLGRASFKGMGKIVVFEIVDADRWRDAETEPVEGESLLSALDWKETGRTATQRP